MSNRLIVITGPTGSGKSALAMRMAEQYGCDIISADSRQMFREIPIGTAAPTADDLARVTHHFIGNLSLGDYYSAAQYEEEVMRLLPSLWRKSPVQIMCGGSMMYIDAVTRGIDQLPTISDDIRRHAWEIYEKGGLQQLRLTLLELDPLYYREVDLNNHKRLVHAIEICLQAGVPYSSLRTGRVKPRDFDIEMLAIDMPRDILFDRINRRVNAMIDSGLVDEARAVSHLRHLNSLNTVGYKELWPYIDGLTTLDEAITKIARNTRVYAKKQLTWLKSRPHRLIMSNEQ
ncbi:MAG: tRNA (adenosine(37)-N6)-dimethylallyltransferase MiaA [Muribaculaceae bacterium]|nr:tRNA (adenosine(37)-N6)-dimethylallyltransferase MiaA [Muribaculaceae bacterium]MDE6345060.1 tRNA (adenosine(37)-N6)-dimethylallyltransferase MiaA [Muribaculaceae bacterium]